MRGEADGGATVVVAPFDVPWADRAPRMERLREHRWITVAAVGQPHPRATRLSVQRSTARERGEQRARDALHGWVDDALARIRARPQVATSVHRAVRTGARVLGVRPLADGAAVVVMGVRTDVLVAAAPLGEVPWAR
jgi:hypothetical protein